MTFQVTEYPEEDAVRKAIELTISQITTGERTGAKFGAIITLSGAGSYRAKAACSNSRKSPTRYSRPMARWSMPSQSRERMRPTESTSC
jgi:hypothetical protein